MSLFRMAATLSREKLENLKAEQREDALVYSKTTSSSSARFCLLPFQFGQVSLQREPNLNYNKRRVFVSRVATPKVPALDCLLGLHNNFIRRRRCLPHTSAGESFVCFRVCL